LFSFASLTISGFTGSSYNPIPANNAMAKLWGWIAPVTLLAGKYGQVIVQPGSASLAGRPKFINHQIKKHDH